MRLGFAGTPDFAVAALNALVAAGHSIAAVFTKPDRPAGRGRALQVSPIKQRAQALGLPLYQPSSFKDPELHAMLRRLALDALIVVAYGLILPEEALLATRLGCFNIHASLLPRWRGAAPIERALLAADAVTGITIMRMDAGLDTGPMVARREICIATDDTAGSLHDRLAVVGGQLIFSTLDLLAAGLSVEQPQPTAGITYALKISKAEALIDWNDDAQQVVRRVRAFNPRPVAETRLNGGQLRLWEAEAVMSDALPESAPGTVLAATAQGIDVASGRGVVRIKSLQLAGRKRLAAGEFIKAQELVGMRLVGS